MRVTTDKQPHSNKSYQNLIWWTNRIEMFSAEMILTRKATSCMHIVPCLPIHICACHCTRGGTTYQIWCHFFLRLHLSLWKTDGITCWHPSGLWKYELFRLPCHGPTVTYFRSILTITRPIWQTGKLPDLSETSEKLDEIPDWQTWARRVRSSTNSRLTEEYKDPLSGQHGDPLFTAGEGLLSSGISQ